MQLKITLTYLFISWQVILYAQQTKSPQAMAHMTFGRGLVCKGSADVCSLTMSGKAGSNVVMSYQPKTQVLMLQFDASKLDKANKNKLTARLRTKDSYTYRFTYDNPLPPDIVAALGLKGQVYIKKGTYPVRRVKGNFVLKVSLVFK
jgi:hypothetical protein